MVGTGGASGGGAAGALSSGGTSGTPFAGDTGGSSIGGAGRGAGGDTTLDGGGREEAGDGAAIDGTSLATPSCSPAKPHASGDSKETFDFGGASRDYIVHVPTGYDGGKRLPLVVDLHGYTSWAEEQATRTKWGAKADTEKFIVVDPDGIDKSWNATICCGTAMASMIDDVAFMRAVVTRISTALCIDPKRVYLSGHSNGGMMTFKLGCQAADIFAAIAPVAGATPAPGMCHPSRPISVAMIRALQDGSVPYAGKGTGDTRFQSAMEDLDTWKGLDHCASTPVVMSHNGVCQTYTQCMDGTEVELCSPRGDHLFFFANAAGNPDNLLVPDTAWEFFSRHSL
jgi:polyhydroxybutyrate depolymerase